jgi:hypothetical protein
VPHAAGSAALSPWVANTESFFSSSVLTLPWQLVHQEPSRLFLVVISPDEPPAGDPIPGLAYLLRLPEG